VLERVVRVLDAGARGHLATLTAAARRIERRLIE
jgi:hypothetical protein